MNALQELVQKETGDWISRVAMLVAPDAPSIAPDDLIDQVSALRHIGLTLRYRLASLEGEDMLDLRRAVASSLDQLDALALPGTVDATTVAPKSEPSKTRPNELSFEMGNPRENDGTRWIASAGLSLCCSFLFLGLAGPRTSSPGSVDLSGVYFAAGAMALLGVSILIYGAYLMSVTETMRLSGNQLTVTQKGFGIPYETTYNLYANARAEVLSGLIQPYRGRRTELVEYILMRGCDDPDAKFGNGLSPGDRANIVKQINEYLDRH